MKKNLILFERLHRDIKFIQLVVAGWGCGRNKVIQKGKKRERKEFDSFNGRKKSTKIKEKAICV